MSLKTWFETYIKPVPEWKLRNEARDRYVALVLNTQLTQRVAELRADYPQMSDDAALYHVRAEAEHEFWMRLLRRGTQTT